MKKLILIVITLLIFIILPAYSISGYYMAPYGGGTYINLANEWPEVTIDGNSGTGNGTDIFDEKRLVILGGIDSIKSGWLGIGDEKSKYGIKIEFDSSSYQDGYFWFTKQSDPEFRRPFSIQIGTRIYREGLRDTNQYESKGLIGAQGNDVLEAISDGLLSSAGDFFLGSGTYFVVFEFGIVLPGKIQNGILVMDDGKTSYPIAAGVDYSAEIQVTVTLVDLENNNSAVSGYAPISFIVPFSGYYDPRQTSEPDTDTSASLYVLPNARAANIDLLNDQGKTDIPIADVDFSVFGLTGDGNYDDSVFLFLSSSSNPFDSSASKFRFIHKNVGFGEAITDSNSIGYKVRAVPDQETIDASNASVTTSDNVFEVTYDGTDYLTTDGSHPEESQRMNTACYKYNLGHLYDNAPVHWHSYSGTLYLELDTNNVIMDEGLYRSTVYVHVVTDENLSNSGGLAG